MDRNYDGIDLMKFICAILIVLLHAVETNDIFWVGIQYVTTRFAVPFFFIASGFLYSQNMRREGYTKRYLKRNMFLFILWGVCIYGPILCHDYIVEYRGRNPLLILVVLLRRMFIIGPAQYWYFVALIFSVIILKKIAFSRHASIYLTVILLACFGMNISFSYFAKGTEYPLWVKMISLLYSGSNNFLLTGIPFVGLGILIGKRKEELFGRRGYLILFILATIFSIGEYYIFCRYGLWISVAFIFQGTFIFLFAGSIPSVSGHGKKLRNCSTVVFLTHWIILYNVLNPIMKRVGMNPYYPNYIPIKVVATVCLSVGAYYVISRLNSKAVRRCFGM